MRYVVVAVVSLLVGIGAGAVSERSRAERVEMPRGAWAPMADPDPDIAELLSVYQTIRDDKRVRSREAAVMLAISVVQRRSNEAASRVSSAPPNRLSVVRAGGAEQWTNCPTLPDLSSRKETGSRGAANR